jgi:DNA-binding NarL/FixJ family response regulator
MVAQVHAHEGPAYKPREHAEPIPIGRPRHATLWEDNPDLTASLQFFFRHSGIALEGVTTAEAVTTTAQAMHPDSGHFLVVDCTTLATAFARAASIVGQTAVPIHICHPRQDFVDDLKSAARGPLVWLPPEWAGLVLLDKLRRLKRVALPPATPTTRKESLSLSSLTSREQDVLRLLVGGSSYKQIAMRLGIGLSTVKAHVASAKVHLGVHSREELIAAYRQLIGG